VRVRDRVSAGRIPRSQLKSFAFQFLSEYYLSLLALGLVLAQLDRLAPVDANDIIVCHYMRAHSITQHCASVCLALEKQPCLDETASR
jgi:hypothetical protein